MRAIAISAFERDGKEVIPRGSLILGVVREVRRVGLGFIRERALLDLEFDDYQLPDGRSYPLQARVVGLDNAREEVTAEGRIKGILAASAPYSAINGLWMTPSTGVAERSASGLSGVSGMLNTHLELGPMGALALFAARLAVLRMPEPEIFLPRGAEMRLRIDRIPADAPGFAAPEPVPVPSQLATLLADLPVRLQRAGDGPDADLINVAFLGSRRNLRNAFAAAGWWRAEPLTARSLSRASSAFAKMQGYQTAPVSLLTWEGRKPDLVFEKSFNTLAKRHHVRIWRAGGFNGQELWVGAATHDVGVTVDARHVSLTHRVDPRIDLEREKIVNDFRFTGCTSTLGYVPRAHLPAGGMRTDGALAVLPVDACNPSEPPSATPPSPTRLEKAAHLARRFNLETRNYLLRGNIWYWGYRAVRWCFRPPVTPL